MILADSGAGRGRLKGLNPVTKYDFLRVWGQGLTNVMVLG